MSIDPRKVREQVKDKQATAVTGDIVGAAGVMPEHKETNKDLAKAADKNSGDCSGGKCTCGYCDFK